MSRQQIEENAETYKAQVFKILDPDKTEIRFNSQWLLPLRFEEVVGLCSRYTIARILERDDFAKRYKEGIPIAFHELLYPLAQAYDSVKLACDVEMGGTGQKFNLLMGREIQRILGSRADRGNGTDPGGSGWREQDVEVTPQLHRHRGTAEAMFCKVMRINDEFMFRYYELLADKSLAEIDHLRSAPPMDAKMELARLIVANLRSPADAAHAAQEFDRVVRRGDSPSDIQLGNLPEGVRTGAGIRVDKLLPKVGLAVSVSDATRKIKAGAVEINGRRPNDLVWRDTKEELVVQVGKLWRRILH